MKSYLTLAFLISNLSFACMEVGFNLGDINFKSYEVTDIDAKEEDRLIGRVEEMVKWSKSTYHEPTRKWGIGTIKHGTEGTENYINVLLKDIKIERTTSGDDIYQTTYSFVGYGYKVSGYYLNETQYSNLLKEDEENNRKNNRHVDPLSPGNIEFQIIATASMTKDGIRYRSWKAAPLSNIKIQNKAGCGGE